ncbi:GYF domain-containing protein [Paraflavitalea speifideaquila]|uniref:GYF domain-containing protein n=1 Tax=Paraflavitalea speifideaquila TaxID=3076558 RepID=UPI0028E2C1DD|nr:GYF domain-containing protein [Paraflavitalea speifideiaquila]
MNKYLLLRDNKQTGPYSVEELKEKGLKPYDLVWLDGRSAAWRYPSEIAELSSFAPAVEEQPYDRFYKKKPAQQATAQSSAKNGIQQETVHTEAVVVTTPVAVTTNVPQNISTKKIYVTLPAGAGNRNNNTTTTANTTPANTDKTEADANAALLLDEKFARLREEK